MGSWKYGLAGQGRSSRFCSACMVHVAGLNLSRAWCMKGIASALPADDPRVPILMESAREYAKLGFSYVFSGHYEGEHWLATFAIYTLTI